MLDFEFGISEKRTGSSPSSHRWDRWDRWDRWRQGSKRPPRGRAEERRRKKLSGWASKRGNGQADPSGEPGAAAWRGRGGASASNSEARRQARTDRQTDGHSGERHATESTEAAAVQGLTERASLFACLGKFIVSAHSVVTFPVFLTCPTTAPHRATNVIRLAFRETRVVAASSLARPLLCPASLRAFDLLLRRPTLRQQRTEPQQAPPSRILSSQVATMGGDTEVGIHHRNDWWKFPAVKLSTEYDSEGSMFANKMSARVFNGLAKLTGSIQREPSGDLRYPILGVFTKYLSVLYDHEDRNALVTMNADFSRNLSVKYQRDIKAQQGEVKVQAHTANLRYKTEISYDVPATALPKVACTFPLGQLKAEEVELDGERAIALSGFLGGSLFNGQVVASYSDESATLKYTFKDEELTLVPSVSWPQLSPSLALKRQFGPRNKLSYFHNFETTTWSAVYKYKPVDDFKVKLGYDSDVRLCWSSFWVGKEDSGAKTAPRKCKLQVMLQVPQDDVKSGVLLFRVKKRWDLC